MSITFYDESLKSECSAHVLCTQEDEKGIWVLLNQTLFFPESGGMHRDHGTINDLQVLDLKTMDGEVWHLLKEPVYGTVELKLDLNDRLERMQLHSSQHLVSALFIQEYGIDTLSHHAFADRTGDLELECTEITDEMMQHIEDLANAAITDDIPITVSYIKEEEARNFTKDFSDYEGLDMYRLVTIQGLDNNLCGCPHVPSTHYLKAIQLIDRTKIKDHMKVTLRCGDVLIRQSHAEFNALHTASTQLSIPLLEVNSGIVHLKEQLKEALSQASLYKSRALDAYKESRTRELDPKTIHVLLEEDPSLSVKDVQYLASYYSSLGFIVTVAVVPVDENNCFVLVARGPDLKNVDAGKIFQQLRSQGFKGGGNPSIAQGKGPYDPCLGKRIMELVQAQLSA